MCTAKSIALERIGYSIMWAKFAGSGKWKKCAMWTTIDGTAQTGLTLSISGNVQTWFVVKVTLYTKTHFWSYCK